MEFNLSQLADKQSKLNLRDLFLSENKFLDKGEWLFDYSKTYLTKEVITGLTQRLETLSFTDKKTALLNGEYLNVSEERKVFHTALRNPVGTIFETEILQVWQQIEQITHRFRSKKLLGSTGKPLKYVVNIGIGGSYLGPKMVVEALRDLDPLTKNCRFISNIDQFELTETLRDFPLEETLFIVASKSFSTLETLLNANFIKDIFLEKGLDYSAHFYALSSNVEKAVKWGISKTQILPFWDWVGGTIFRLGSHRFAN